MLQKYFKPDMSQFQDKNLKALAELIPQTLLKSRAKSTITHDLRGSEKWKDWCKKFPELEVTPAKALSLTLFILSHIQNNSSFHLVKQTFYGIKWVHSPLSLKSFQILHGKYNLRSCQKMPIKTNQGERSNNSHLYQLAKIYGKSRKNLINAHTLMICVLGFAAFLRYKELASLHRCDISLTIY